MHLGLEIASFLCLTLAVLSGLRTLWRHPNKFHDFRCKDLLPAGWRSQADAPTRSARQQLKVQGLIYVLLTCSTCFCIFDIVARAAWLAERGWLAAPLKWKTVFLFVHIGIGLGSAGCMPCLMCCCRTKSFVRCVVEGSIVAAPTNPIDWVYCAAIGLGGGLIQNIVNPSQRGFGGFVASAAVGTFCGFLGGVIAHEFQASEGVQWLCSGAAGVFGFAILQGVFSFLNNRKHGSNYHIFGGQTHIGPKHYGDGDMGERDMSEGVTYNVSGEKCQQNINSPGATMNQWNTPPGTAPDVSQIYNVIAAAIPESDTEARQAADYLKQRETSVEETEGSEEVREKQSLLARYKGPILSALGEMGLAWLQTAYPQVVLVKPLIKMAIDSIAD